MARFRVCFEFDLDDSGTRSPEHVVEEIRSEYAMDIAEDYGRDPETGEAWGGYSGPFISNLNASAEPV